MFLSKKFKSALDRAQVISKVNQINPIHCGAELRVPGLKMLDLSIVVRADSSQTKNVLLSLRPWKRDSEKQSWNWLCIAPKL